MNEEKTVLWLRHMEHFCGLLWHQYSVSADQAMAATATLSKQGFKLNHKKPFIL
jgi:hypothetical protein